MVNELIKRVNAQGYKLFVENSAMEIIVNESFSETYGARNIKRVICRRIEDLLSDAIITKDIKIGDKIVVFGENGNVTYKKG